MTNPWLIDVDDATAEELADAAHRLGLRDMAQRLQAAIDAEEDTDDLQAEAHAAITKRRYEREDRSDHDHDDARDRAMMEDLP
jgi:hypothetical protein